MTRVKGKRSLIRDRDGTALVEFSLLVPLLLALTFGIADFGALFYQYQSVNAAAAAAARMAATRGPVITGLNDCGVGVTAGTGAYCYTAAASRTWTERTCTGASPAGYCNTTLMNRIVQEMQIYYPKATINNLNITFSASGLGFQGMGKPVPMVRVDVVGLTADFVVIPALGLAAPTLPAFTATVPAEDLSGT